MIQTESIYYNSDIACIEDAESAFTFRHGECTVKIPYDSITRVILESNMGAKNGASMKLTVEANDAALELESKHIDFFKLLFDILSERLDTDTEAIFFLASSNTREQKVIYEKQIAFDE